MRYGFVIPGGDAPGYVETAVEIERAGWDAVFIAEAVYGTDAWTTLGAMAARTERVLLGTLLTPPSRRRPWKLASEVATLDHLSGGRAVLTVGLGALDTGFGAVGEATDRRERAELMDECLELLTRFWSGEPFSYEGKHYRVTWDFGWYMASTQRPRVPIWVVGLWPSERSMARALRWDGAIPTTQADDGSWGITPEDVREIAAYARERRPDDAPWEIVVEGLSPGGDADRGASAVRQYAEAGATWWIESMWDVPGGMDAVRARIAQGPPRVG